MEHTSYNGKHGGCELPTHALQDLVEITQTPWTHTLLSPKLFIFLWPVDGKLAEF